ncbi:hypothetical protein BC939DRAFT_184083 [Gamsiella multidivaricata]|uniref:uncharacterized protein n=1 Tax=Gamsiella multidivaricata TaxID=101098 RepID=UPI002220DA57|nr:uncharacterized protein BC939DRAFT_184083 [Gamsiella multidivaricata]KAI7831361.1 hypothetical protein BC939DRAFT_184083 [Gamsiella multidivaricata]
MQPSPHHDSGHSGARSAAGPSSSSSSSSSSSFSSLGLSLPPNIASNGQQNNQHHGNNGHALKVNENTASANGTNTAATAFRPPPPPISTSANKQQQHSRTSSSGQNQGHSRHTPNGYSQTTGPEKGAPGSATSMGEGIANQFMKEDIENWVMALGLSPDLPIHVIGFFGHARDLSLFGDTSPVTDPNEEIGIFDDVDNNILNEKNLERDVKRQRGGLPLGLNDLSTAISACMSIGRRIH